MVKNRFEDAEEEDDIAGSFEGPAGTDTGKTSPIVIARSYF